MFDLDFFVPTLKKRTDNLLCQVHTALNSGVNVRVSVSIPDDTYPELTDNLTPKEKERFRLVKNVPQGTPVIPSKYCVENISWNDWVLIMADDDCLLPWGIKHLWEARKDVSMVMGQTLGVSRTRHLDFSAWKIGHSVVEGHCSTVMFNMRKLETFPKPWFENSPVGDFMFIKRMADNFPHKIIPSVVHVQSFAELENLGSDFSNNFNKLYGHLV